MTHLAHGRIGKSHGFKLALLTTGLWLAWTGIVSAQGLEYVKAHYTKYEYKIPMRDGKKLFTSVYVPKDTSVDYPMLLCRTPYSVSPYGVDEYPGDLGPSPLFGKEGYIFVYQDVRGRNMSEGEFINMRPYLIQKNGAADIDESSDTFDTIDWLTKNVKHHNGKVGQYGISYPGFYTAAGMIDAHPALKASSPQAPVTDWFIGDDFHHHGALFLPHLFNFIADFGKPRPFPTKKYPPRFEHGTHDGYQFFLDMGPLSQANARYLKDDVAFWNDVMHHANYDDFWKARNLRQHLKNIRPAVMTVGGWFDAENLFGALEVFKKTGMQSPETTNNLVMGPWRHGGWSRGDGERLGPVHFNAKTSLFYQENIEFPFFQYHLKGKGDWKPPKAWIFETGTNQWRKYDVWPPRQSQARAVYFQPGGGLAFDPPPSSEKAFDQYVSDPAKPAPYFDKITIGMAAEYMVGDQRLAGRRTDVLVYQTPALEEDVTLAGPLEADLFVSTSGTDSDWIVKLIDVYPDEYSETEQGQNQAGHPMGGYQQLVRGEVMRGRFRNSYEKPEPFEPGKVAEVKFALQDIAHTFRPGHRIMIQVQSSWFPLVDRNPQTFVDIYEAKPGDFKAATQRVYRMADTASRLNVRVMSSANNK